MRYYVSVAKIIYPRKNQEKYRAFILNNWDRCGQSDIVQNKISALTIFPASSSGSWAELAALGVMFVGPKTRVKFYDYSSKFSAGVCRAAADTLGPVLLISVRGPVNIYIWVPGCG